MSKKKLKKLNEAPKTSTKIKEYGKMKRLCNETAIEGVYVCTVCGKEVIT